MIERFSLRERYNTETMVDTRKALEDVTVIQAGRDGLIAIDVEDKDPKTAAAMANAYVEELERLTKQLAVTDAAQRRLFFERELTTSREKLAASEGALRVTQEKTGLIQPEGQARAIFDAFAELSARIAAKEVELASIRMFATAQNPNYLRAQQELQSLQTQLVKLEKNQATSPHASVLLPTTKVPEAGMEYLRSVRDLKHQEALYELLTKQYELAKIEEAKDAALIQLVDRAVPPDRKAKPKRALILLIVVAVAGLVAVLCSLMQEIIENTRRRPDGSHRLALLRSHLRLR
jgi:tyrosine-protein kinase Etk/Wzc